MEQEDHRLKELKVVIPTDLHLLLVRRKLLHGHTIAATVEEALRRYFATHEQAPAPRAAAPAPSPVPPVHGNGQR